VKDLAGSCIHFSSGLAKYYLLLFQDCHLLPPHYCPTSSLILCHVGCSSTIKMETADSSKHWYLSTNLLSVTSHQTVIFIVLICYCPFQVCQLCHCFGLISYIYILIVICTLAKRYTHTVSNLCTYFYRVNIMQAVNRFSTCLLDHIKTHKRLTNKSLDIQVSICSPEATVFPTVPFRSNLQQFHDNPRHWRILQSKLVINLNICQGHKQVYFCYSMPVFNIHTFYLLFTY